MKSLKLAQRIELWPVDRGAVRAERATHSPEQVAQIAASIAEFGFNAPILVDSNAGIVAGQGGCWRAQVGLAEVPVVVLDHLSETQRRAYIIADNRLALNAGWDEKLAGRGTRGTRERRTGPSLVGFSDNELEASAETDGNERKR